MRRLNKTQKLALACWLVVFPIVVVPYEGSPQWWKLACIALAVTALGLSWAMILDNFGFGFGRLTFGRKDLSPPPLNRSQ